MATNNDTKVSTVVQKTDADLLFASIVHQSVVFYAF